MKKFFWRIEYSITVFILAGILMFMLPMRFENYFQAKMISRWNDRFEKVSYLFSVINTQITDDILISFAKVQTKAQREQLLLQLIKPYLRLIPIENIKHYNPKFLNGKRTTKKDFYYFGDLYQTTDKQIVGIKDIKQNGENNALFMLMFDINGYLPPNTWGRDIFGIYIYDSGKVVPFGYSKDMDELKLDCSKEGTGTSCSYYYRIGGGW